MVLVGGFEGLDEEGKCVGERVIRVGLTAGALVVGALVVGLETGALVDGDRVVGLKTGDRVDGACVVVGLVTGALVFGALLVGFAAGALVVVGLLVVGRDVGRVDGADVNGDLVLGRFSVGGTTGLRVGLNVGELVEVGLEGAGVNGLLALTQWSDVVSQRQVGKRCAHMASHS